MVPWAYFSYEDENIDRFSSLYQGAFKVKLVIIMTKFTENLRCVFEIQ